MIFEKELPNMSINDELLCKLVCKLIMNHSVN